MFSVILAPDGSAAGAAPREPEMTVEPRPGWLVVRAEYGGGAIEVVRVVGQSEGPPAWRVERAGIPRPGSPEPMPRVGRLVVLLSFPVSGVGVMQRLGYGDSQRPAALVRDSDVVAELSEVPRPI